MLSLDAIAPASLVVLLATMDSDERGKVVAKMIWSNAKRRKKSGGERGFFCTK